MLSDLLRMYCGSLFIIKKDPTISCNRDKLGPLDAKLDSSLLCCFIHEQANFMETKNRLVGAKDREEGEARVAVGLLESLNFGK